jgi:hypothetical protein
VFTNPFELSMNSGAAPVQSTPSTLAADLFKGVELGVSLWAHSKQQEKQAEANQLQEQAVQIGAQRLQEYKTIRDERGQVQARKWLSNTYLEDVKAIGPNGRKTYMSTIKDILGGSPVDLENEAESALAEQQQKSAQGYITLGRELAAGGGVDTANLTDDQLYSMGVTWEGKSKINSARAQELSIFAQEDNIESTERRNITNKLIFDLIDMEDEIVNSQLNTLYNAYSTKQYTVTKQDADGNPVQVVLTGDEAIKQAEADVTAYISMNKDNVRQTVRETIKAAGGDPSMISEADYTMFENDFNRLENMLTGKHLQGINEQQFKTITAVGNNRTFINSPDWLQQIILSRLTGAQVSVPQTAERLGESVDGVLSSNPVQSMIDRASMTFRFGPAAAAVTSANPEQAVKETTENVVAAIEIEYPEEKAANRRQAAAGVFNAVLEGDSSDPALRRLANYKGGLIEVHKTFARYPDKAKAFGADMRLEAERRGVSLESTLANQFNRFTMETLIPSLRTSGLTRGNPLAGQDVIKVSTQGDTVKFSLDMQKVMSSEALRTQSGISGTTIQMQQVLRKAEADLNIMLKSFKNLTEGDATELATQAAFELQKLLDSLK